jgi:hypothetical protein
MRKSTFKTTHIRFSRWIVWYGDFLKRLIEARRVVRTKQEKLELVEALVHRVTVRWEVLVLEDIVTSLNRDSSKYAESLGLRLRTHLTKDECQAMLTGHRYLDFKSVGEIKDFGRKYLTPKCNAFRAIPQHASDLIDEFMVMRNFLAHYSPYARRSYERLMRGKYHYERVREPGAFLVTLDQSTQEYRWSKYLRAFFEASKEMLKAVK